MANLHSPTPQWGQAALSALLVLLESIFTLMLRLDPMLRRRAYTLAERGTIVLVRSYVPNVEFYATFSFKGVFLDAHLPIGAQPSATINGYSFQYAQVLASDKAKDVDALQILADTDIQNLLHAFLTRLGVVGFSQAIMARFAQKDTPTPDERKRTQAHKIESLSQDLHQATLTQARLQAQVQEMQDKQKKTLIALVVAVLVALVALIAHFFR